MHPVIIDGSPARERAAAVATAAATGHDAVIVLGTRGSEIIRARDEASVLVPAGADLAGALRDLPPEASTCRSARRTLAVVSPWPPTKSGVADYAAATLAALSDHYDVTAVCDHACGDWSTISRADFTEAWWQFDRVLYHLGNSVHHSADLDLLAAAPGAVIVHDAVLTGAILGSPDALGHPGGGAALLAHDGPPPPDGELDLRGVRTALAPALGVLVHSQHAVQLLRRAGVTSGMLRATRLAAPVRTTRLERAPISPDAGPPVLAHFGFVNEFKGADVLVEAAADLASAGVPCRVVFVGEFASDSLRARVLRQAGRLGVPATVTGFVSPTEWEGWLTRAACAVQLREQSHGESSAALGELFAAGLPVVCTDIGSFAELPEGVVRHVPPGVTPGALARALQDVLDPVTNHHLGEAAERYAAMDCSPAIWAAAVRDLLEDAYTTSFAVRYANASTRAFDVDSGSEGFELRGGASAGRAVWTSDVSVYANTPFFSGIQRVTSRLHDELSRALPEEECALAPARLTEGLPDRPHPEIARDSMTWLPSVPLDMTDWLLCIDHNVRLTRCRAELLAAREAGLRVATVVYDIIPVTNPEWFPREGGDVTFAGWLDCVLAVSDLVIAISAATASEVKSYVAAHPPARSDPLRLAVVPCGWDLSPAAQPLGVKVRDADHFLMVGTVEPRKGHAQVLDTFERMWAAGSQARLTVVGRRGWLVADLQQRMSRLDRSEPRFRWLERASDAELGELYDRCTAVIMASWAEGFGLPVVEAALRDCPVILRDIPVLREVAGETAVYFAADGSDLAETITNVVDRTARCPLPRRPAGHVRTWREVALDLIGLLTDRVDASEVWSPEERMWRRV
jgi:glycosyltransferase involved in cell wall biosynthesis